MGGRGAASGLRTSRSLQEASLFPEKMTLVPQEGPKVYTPKDVTEEYYDAAEPNIGHIIIEEAVRKKDSRAEIAMAEYLLSKFGGNIIVIKDADKKGVYTSDYIWNEKLWDLKTVSSEKAANSAVRHGLKQIAFNPGGIILDYRKHDINVDSVLDQIRGRLYNRHFKEKVDILIITDERIVVYRYDEIKK